MVLETVWNRNNFYKIDIKYPIAFIMIYGCFNIFLGYSGVVIYDGLDYKSKLFVLYKIDWWSVFFFGLALLAAFLFTYLWMIIKNLICKAYNKNIAKENGRDNVIETDKDTYAEKITE